MRDDLTAGARPALAWAEHGGETRLRLTGLAADIDERDLAVVVGEAAAPGARPLQPMAGRFVRSPDGVDFIPRFPFLAGTAYALVVAACAAAPGGLTLPLRREAETAPPTATVAAIHPDVESAPFNLLKVYVRFSEPMAEGAARLGVRVENALTGERLDGVFLDMDPELWDRERRRLTLLLDPGRIKRGLGPHEEAGYPLAEGQPVRITIGEGFRSAAGAPLRSTFSRTYAVGPAIRSPVDPAAWRLDLPPEGSVAPLTVAFDRPLDHAMLQHALRVVDGEGAAVGGTGSTAPGDASWAFQPAEPWRDRPHQLIVDARLEDLAGNSLRRVFDRDLSREDDLGAQADHIALLFHCASPAGLAEADRMLGPIHP